MTFEEELAIQRHQERWSDEMILDEQDFLTKLWKEAGIE